MNLTDKPDQRYLMKNFELKTVRPKEASKEELAQFVAFVTEGGEVAGGLENRVLSAHSLIFLKRCDRMHAVAAVKVPSPEYRRRVFLNAGQASLADKFNFEIGWIFVSMESRGVGLSSQLVSEALKETQESPTFATTRTDNAPMKHVLIRAGFSICGTTYPSNQNVGSELSLFIRA